MTASETPDSSADPVVQSTDTAAQGSGPAPATNAVAHPGALLQVHDVTKVYGSGHTAVTALAEATLAVEKGEFVALLGPSGSGKTTLISIIGGLLAPTSGTVTIGDTDVTSLSRKQLTRFRAERVGFVFQSANLVPFLTARENLLYVAGLVGMKSSDARARADQLLGELGLSDRARNLPEQLSGGERQRVAIGRALMNDPDLVLVDEPTAALDTALGRQVVQLLRREIKDRGKTGIMVTHDLRMVEYTDRVFEILDGHLTHVESPSALGH